MALSGTQMFMELANHKNPAQLCRGSEPSRAQAQLKKDRSTSKKKADLQEKDGSLTREAALIRSAQCGDLNSFNQLVLAYQDCLFNTSLNILNDVDLAADMTQNAFISAFRNINKYRGGSFKSWLMRTVINGCYDEIRRQKRQHNIPLEPTNDEDEDMETPRWLTDSGPLPEEQIENNEFEGAIQRCLDALPPTFRAVIVLVDIQGMNYRQVASVMCVPLGTIRSRLARARLSLRKSLRETDQLLPDNLHLEHEFHP